MFCRNAGLALATLLLLAGCGTLPRPFQGDPGGLAMMLRRPPPARLAVVKPTDAMLPDKSADLLETDLVASLVANELPANGDRGKPGDWKLLTTARTEGDRIVPVFTAVDPKGKVVGSTEGTPIPLADWAAAAPATLDAVANSAGPKVTSLLNGIEATMRESDPNSLYNRPARVYVAEVTGAPGDGDDALTKQMRQILGTLGPVVQDTPRNADFAVLGEVKTAPGAGGTTRVEIQWVVRDGADERGRVVQLNEVPPGSLDHYWGDVAVVVAKEAAGGVRDVILTQSGRRKPTGGAAS